MDKSLLWDSLKYRNCEDSGKNVSRKRPSDVVWGIREGHKGKQEQKERNIGLDIHETMEAFCRKYEKNIIIMFNNVWK
jgi:hypothetical protein